MWIPVTWQYEYGDHTAVVLEIDGKRHLHLTATVMVIYVLSMHLVRFCRLPLVVCQEKFFGDCLVLQRTPMEFWTHWIILILWWRYSVFICRRRIGRWRQKRKVSISFSELSTLPPSQVHLAQENAKKTMKSKASSWFELWYGQQGFAFYTAHSSWKGCFSLECWE